MKRLRSILFLFLLCSTRLYSQSLSESNKTKFWLDIGLGGITVNPDYLAESYSINYSKKNTIIKLRYQRCNEWMNLFINPSQKFNSYSLLAGKTYGNDVIHVDASIGLGYVHELYRGNHIKTTGVLISSHEYEALRYRSISVPMEVGFLFKPTKVFGIGAAGTANINPQRSNFGLFIKAAIGLLY